jgi:hypothetical protein
VLGGSLRVGKRLWPRHPKFEIRANFEEIKAPVQGRDYPEMRGPTCLTLLGQYSARSWEWGVCAENNGDRFSNNLFPIPQADKPDF